MKVADPTIDMLTRDTLVDMGRISRPPIPDWIAAINGRLDGIPDQLNVAAIERVSTLLNNSGLLFVCAGERSTAEDLCNMQIAWIEALLSKYDVDEIVQYAVQPWINLGRIYRQKNEINKALHCFASVYERHPDGKVRFGTFVVDPRRVLSENLESLYLFDSAKSYLYSKRYQDGLAFCDRARCLVTTTGAMALLNELEFQLQLRATNFAAAARLLVHCDWSIDRHSILVNTLYRTILAGTNDMRVVELLTKRICESLDTDSDIDHRQLRFALLALTLFLYLGHENFAHALLAAAHKATAAFADIPLCAEVSRLGHAFAPAIAATEQLSSVMQLIRTSYHANLAAQYGYEFNQSREVVAALQCLKQRLVDLLSGLK